MTTPTFTPPRPPTKMSDKPNVRLNRSEFGDGYTQATRDGLNHIRRVLSLEWEVLTVAEALAIETFLQGQGGDRAFLWIPPDQATALKWTCDDWTLTYRDAGFRRITAKFTQSFNL